MHTPDDRHTEMAGKETEGVHVKSFVFFNGSANVAAHRYLSR